MQFVERRKQRRLPLRWPLRVSGKPLGNATTKTENISAQGFYCFLESLPGLGAILECHLTVPNYGPTDSEALRSILCQAEVVRLEVRGKEPGYGVACRILDFQFAKS